MSQTAGSEYEEIVITNYDPRKACWQLSMDSLLGGDGDTRYELIHEPEHPFKNLNNKRRSSMKFVKYNDNKRSVTIPLLAVLTVCGLEDEGKLEWPAPGARSFVKSEMTATEMVRTILALTDRAGQLMRELTGPLRAAARAAPRGTAPSATRTSRS